MSWKAEVIADTYGKWCGNGLCFATEQEAQSYVLDLAMRWTAVRDTRTVESPDAVTHKWTEKGLEESKMIISNEAALALKAAVATRGKHKGQLLARAPRSHTLAYAAWQGAMMALNPYHVSIGGMLCMSAEQKAIREEVTRVLEALPLKSAIPLERNRQALEALGVW
jgi:hypothetical protein